MSLPRRDSSSRSEWFETIVEICPDAIYVIEDGYHVFANPAGLELLGAKSLGDIADRPALEFLDQQFRDPAEVRALAARSGERTGLKQEQVIRLDGSMRHTEASTAPVSYQGRPATLAIARDITDRVVSEAALHRSESRFVAAVAAAPTGIGLLGNDGKIIMANDAFLSLCDPIEPVGLRLDELVHRDFLEVLERLLATPEPAIGTDLPTAQLTLATDQERHFELSIRLVRLDDEASHVVQLRDVTRQKQHEALLTQQACTDRLTGLANRDAFANKLMASLGRPDSAVAVAVCDLDNFKTINESMGHHIGDELLQAVSKRLQDMDVPNTFIARFGGDEFVVLMTDAADRSAAKQLADFLADALGDPFELEGRRVHISASIGVALGGQGTSPDDLLSDADAAMYDAKRNGRARYELADAGHRARARDRLEIDRALRIALANDELEPHYQPIVDILTGTIVAVEALARWCHNGEMISPGVFVPVAEASGLVGELDRYMIRHSARQIQRWVDDGTVDQTFKVSVNVAAQELTDDELVSTLRDILDETGILPSQLVLEVTERDAVESSEAMDGIRAIKDLGVALALDDFGIGHSSLERLSSLPFEVLKIDRTFVAKSTEDDRNARLLFGIASMGASLGHLVLGEGVETAEQYAVLAAAGVNFAQGYLIARPAASEEVAELLRSGKVFLDDSFR